MVQEEHYLEQINFLNMASKEIVDRWGGSELRDFYQKSLLPYFKKGGALDKLNIPAKIKDGDKIDLKGIVLNHSKIYNCTFDKVDFSISIFQSSWIENCVFKNCVFLNVDFSGISDHNNTFDHCTFTNCKFQGAALGYKGSQYKNSTFEKCNFTKTLFSRAEFSNIRFIENKLKNIDFNASSFEDCSFEGKLSDLWFRGGFANESDYNTFGFPKKNQMKNVSFADAEFQYLTFSGDCDLSTVQIKNDNKHFKFDQLDRRLNCLKAELDSFLAKDKLEVEILIKSYERFVETQKWCLISRSELDQVFESSVSQRIIELLTGCK